MNKKALLFLVFLPAWTTVCAKKPPPLSKLPKATPAKTKQTTETFPNLPIKIDAQKKIIPICTSFPLRGDSNIIGRQMLAGVENYLRGFRHFAHDVAKKEKDLVLEYKKNNEFIGDMGLVSIKKMLGASPIFVGLVGTETMLSLKPLIKNKELLLLFPMEGETSLRQLGSDNIIYFRPSHEKELRVLANYAIKIKHKTHVAIFYEASQWGDSVLKTLKTILKDYPISSMVTASYPQGTVDVESALNIISNKMPLDFANPTHVSPNVVFCIAQPRPAYSFISNAINAGLHECLFLGLSNLCIIQKLLKTSKGLDIAVTSVVPNPATCTLPIAKDYKNVMKSFLSFRDDSPFYFEAFINLSIFEQALRDIKGPLLRQGSEGQAITIPSIIQAIKNLKDVKGLPLSYDPTDRSLSSALWINPGIGKEWIQASGPVLRSEELSEGVGGEEE